MKRRIILSQEQTENILNTYAERGMRCIPDLCARYGLSESYIRHLALAHGTKVKKPHGGGYRTHKDKRWAWAIERGAVVI